MPTVSPHKTELQVQRKTKALKVLRQLGDNDYI